MAGYGKRNKIMNMKMLEMCLIKETKANYKLLQFLIFLLLKNYVHIKILSTGECFSLSLAMNTSPLFYYLFFKLYF